MTTLTEAALEAVDELEASARGDEPFNHFAGPLIRQALLAEPAAPQAEPSDAEILVSREATPAMLEAGAMEIAMNEQRVMTAERKAEHVWRAMVRAASASAVENVPDPRYRDDNWWRGWNAAVRALRSAPVAEPAASG